MDYFVICKGKPHKWSPIDGVNWAGFISWIAGSAVAVAFPNLFLPVFNAIVVTSVLYLILYPLFYKNQTRGRLPESDEASA
jgi:purine-cytosine permease-like protein